MTYMAQYKNCGTMIRSLVSTDAVPAMYGVCGPTENPVPSAELEPESKSDSDEADSAEGGEEDSGEASGGEAGGGGGGQTAGSRGVVARSIWTSVAIAVPWWLI